MKNVVEAFVSEEYQRLRPTLPDFCGCDLCRDDVLVYALNRLPARYVAQTAGEVISRVRMEADQSRANVAVVLLEAFRRVHAQPRDGHPERSRPAAG